MFFRALLSRQAVIWSWLLSCGKDGWGFLRKTHTLTFTYVLKNSWLIPCAAHSIYQCKSKSTDIPFCSCTRLLSCTIIPLAPKDCHRMWAKGRRENPWVQSYASVTHTQDLLRCVKVLTVLIVSLWAAGMQKSLRVSECVRASKHPLGLSHDQVDCNLCKETWTHMQACSKLASHRPQRSARIIPKQHSWRVTAGRHIHPTGTFWRMWASVCTCVHSDTHLSLYTWFEWGLGKHAPLSMLYVRNVSFSHPYRHAHPKQISFSTTVALRRPICLCDWCRWQVGNWYVGARFQKALKDVAACLIWHLPPWAHRQIAAFCSRS